MIRKKALASPDLFIHAVPHMSFVHGAAHVAYLKRRYAALTAHHLYRGMEFTEDKQTLRDWFPLVMEGRPDSDIIAATRMITGADVNYGALTRSLIGYLQTLSGFAIHYSRRVTGLQPRGRRPLAHRNDRCDQQRANIDHRKIRLSRRRRRRLAAPAEIGDSGSERLRRLPGQRHLAALRRPGHQQTASRQSLRHGRCRFAADVRSSPRYPGHRRHPFDSVRALCRFLHQVPETRLMARSVRLDPARQHSADHGSRFAQFQSR